MKFHKFIVGILGVLLFLQSITKAGWVWNALIYIDTKTSISGTLFLSVLSIIGLAMVWYGFFSGEKIK